MLQNPCKTLGSKKNMVYKIAPGGQSSQWPIKALKHMFDPYSGYQFYCIPGATSYDKVKSLELKNHR